MSFEAISFTGLLAIKGIKIDKVKSCFEQWEKSLDRCTASKGDYLEADKFKRVRINTQFFINKVCFGVPPSYDIDYK